MKTLSIILVSFILAFSAQPLLSHIAQKQNMTSDVVTHECCGQCSGDCCGDTSEEPCDDSSDSANNDCTDNCSCAIDGMLVFTQAISPEILLFETIFEKIRSSYTSYQFTLPSTIWHPPQLAMS